jgi:protein SCO1/2
MALCKQSHFCFVPLHLQKHIPFAIFNPVKRKILILLFLLSFPSVLYVVLTTGKHHALRLAYLGPKQLAPNGKDTLYHTVPSFKFVNQAGDTISDKFYDGKIYVAAYFYTSCNTNACKRMAAQILRLQEKFGYTNGLIQMLYHTIKPESDSVPALSAYAKMVHADTRMWNFVTGDKANLLDIAKQGYLIEQDDTENPSEMFVLVDKEKRVRGMYSGTKIQGVNDLIDGIKALMAEYVIKETETKKIEQKR